jgi:cysteine desulfurase
VGGGQENGRRAGTENVASIVGLGKAAECAAEFLEEENTRVRPMRDRFEKTITEKVVDTSVNGQRAIRLPNTANLSFKGVEAQSVLMLLDQQGICCSAGSACRSGATDGSHVLRAMKVSDEWLRGTVRFSFGRFNSNSDIDRAISILPNVIEKLRRMSVPPSAKTKLEFEPLS